MRIVGIDIETHDPHLKDKGVSWVYGEGEVLCTSLYFADTKEKKVLKGAPEDVRDLMLDSDVTLVGANIQYDIGWLETVLGIRNKTKAQLVDVFFAEALIDEYSDINLDNLAKKYLKRGKSKNGLEVWADLNGLKGDFRKHLKDAPWNLLEEYALDDAELPVLIYEKQLRILERDDLMSPFMVDCNLIKVVLNMKYRGARVDVKKKKENADRLQKMLDDKRSRFIRKYGNVNLASPKQVAALMDREDVPYRMKVTLKAYNGEKVSWSNLKRLRDRANETVKGFKADKDKLVMKIDKQFANRISQTLEKSGWDFIMNPNVDSKFLLAASDEYPVCSELISMKKIDSVLSKFLGDTFDRFVVKGRVHGDFNISKGDEYGTKSGRLSCLSIGSQVLTREGYVPIQHVSVGSLVFTHTGALAHVKNVIFNGVRDCVELTTDKGSSIICTADHKIFSTEGVWSRADELKEVSIVGFKKASFRQRTEKENCRDVPVEGEANSSGSCRSCWRDTAHSAEGAVRGPERRCDVCRESTSVVEREGRGKEPDVREVQKEAPQLEGCVLRQQRSLHDNSGWHSLLPSQGCICKGTRYSSKGPESEYRNTPHRRKSSKQQLEQSCCCNKGWAQKLAQEVEHVVRVSSVGSLPVFDLEVDHEDHSFIAEGFPVHNCSNPNLQQIPARGELDKGKDTEISLLCREVFIPEKDCWMLKIDYSQIEYRLLVHYAMGPGAEDVRKQFNSDPNTDYHEFVMGITGLDRKPAKNCNFGIMYGMGAGGMQDTFGWSRERVEEILEQYHDAIPYVKYTMNKVQERAKKNKFIITIGGRKAHLRSEEQAYVMLNRLNQGGSADIMKASMLKAYEEGIIDRLNICITVHDELVGSVPKTKKGVKDLMRLREIMETAYKLRVPVIAEPELGDNWHSVRNYREVISEAGL